ncbi:MAG: hypothetical protein IPM53_20765 [Anaerolineaceae bacterium]|nr:hypothetical protein [Anaerolineaceae bacterium]
MGAKEYSGSIDSVPFNTDLWLQSEIDVANQVITDLQAGQSLSFTQLDAITQAGAKGLNHPTYGRETREFIEGLYHTAPTALGQAHVVGNLLQVDNIDLIEDLLMNQVNQHGENPLADQLGAEGTNKLLQVAATEDEVEQNAVLMEWAIELMPYDRPANANVTMEQIEDAQREGGTLQHSVGELIDTAVMESLLLAPGSTPVTLSARFEHNIPSFQAALLSKIVSS